MGVVENILHRFQKSSVLFGTFTVLTGTLWFKACESHLLLDSAEVVMIQVGRMEAPRLKL